MKTSSQKLVEEATAFLANYHRELGKSQAEFSLRLANALQEIAEFGTYTHTYDELVYGAKVAWRNSNRCIGRLFWQSLQVFDARDNNIAQSVVDALINHISYATNGGKVRSAITIFAPDHPTQPQKASPVRIFNHQLIRYAGYDTRDGVVGDAHSIPFTRLCQELGWHGAGTAFDVLPLVIQAHGEPKRYFPIPELAVLQVPLTHPEYPEFASLQLQWYAVPMISDMSLEIGGIRYPAAPFNGWYMGTEIGARNLADETRYNQLRKVAEVMGLPTNSESSLWRDKALVELNVAVLHSFRMAGVSIVDHHTAAKQFERFEQIEADEGRSVTGSWTWLIPPLSPATTHIFHQHYDNTIVTPNYFHKTIENQSQCPFHQ